MRSALLRTAIIADRGARQAGGSERLKGVLLGKGHVLFSEFPQQAQSATGNVPKAKGSKAQCLCAFSKHSELCPPAASPYSRGSTE